MAEVVLLKVAEDGRVASRVVVPNARVARPFGQRAVVGVHASTAGKPLPAMSATQGILRTITRYAHKRIEVSGYVVSRAGFEPATH